MLNFELHRHERCGTMVLRPVELDAPGYPWTRKAYKSRLDDVLPIEKIVAIDLVKAYVDAAANFRKNHEPQIFIFDMERLPSMIVSLRRDPVNKRQGIHATAAALIYAFLKKHRIRIRRIGQIGEDVDFLLPGFDWTAFSDGSFRKEERMAFGQRLRAILRLAHRTCSPRETEILKVRIVYDTVHTSTQIRCRVQPAKRNRTSPEVCRGNSSRAYRLMPSQMSKISAPTFVSIRAALGPGSP